MGSKHYRCSHCGKPGHNKRACGKPHPRPAPPPPHLFAKPTLPHPQPDLPDPTTTPTYLTVEELSTWWRIGQSHNKADDSAPAKADDMLSFLNTVPPQMLETFSAHEWEHFLDQHLSFTVHVHVLENSALPDPVRTSLAAHSSDENVLIRLAHNPKLETKHLDRFARIAKTYRLLRLVAQHPNSDSNVLATVVSPETLSEFPASAGVNLTAAVVGNRNCPPNLLQKYSTSSDTVTVTCIAQHPNLPEPVMQSFATKGSTMVKILVTRNPAVTENVLRILLHDRELQVRIAAKRELNRRSGK